MATTVANNRTALATFRGSARKMAPTRQHRAALWENMLGTVYAMDAAGVVQYFDYDYAAAVKHIGAVEDVRVARFSRYRTRLGVDGMSESYMLPRDGQLVWFVRSREV